MENFLSAYPTRIRLTPFFCSRKVPRIKINVLFYTQGSIISNAFVSVSCVKQNRPRKVSPTARKCLKTLWISSGKASIYSTIGETACVLSFIITSPYCILYLPPNQQDGGYWWVFQRIIIPAGSSLKNQHRPLPLVPCFNWQVRKKPERMESYYINGYYFPDSGVFRAKYCFVFIRNPFIPSCRITSTVFRRISKSVF